MNIPNALTLARIILVPLIVWLIISHEMATAFVLFLLAGLSDAVDGYLAKRFGWQTRTHISTRSPTRLCSSASM